MDYYIFRDLFEFEKSISRTFLAKPNGEVKILLRDLQKRMPFDWVFIFDTAYR